MGTGCFPFDHCAGRIGRPCGVIVGVLFGLLAFAISRSQRLSVRGFCGPFVHLVSCRKVRLFRRHFAQYGLCAGDIHSGSPWFVGAIGSELLGGCVEEYPAIGDIAWLVGGGVVFRSCRAASDGATDAVFAWANGRIGRCGFAKRILVWQGAD